MKKVITYGTYDILHYGHINLLQRAKALGDYLIVGVTSDDFDKSRGKINVQQSLEERVAAIQALGIADKIIIEEYEGQKIDDIRRYEVDIFTVGSDWIGFFDYLNEYCKVVYLPRTEGVSSTELRSSEYSVRLGIVGYSSFLNKFYNESKFVNSVNIVGLCSDDCSKLSDVVKSIEYVTDDFNSLLNRIDAVYIHSHPRLHYAQCKAALSHKINVLCESPIANSKAEYEELVCLAKNQGCVLMEGIRTAYLTAYSRLLLLLKAGKIGKIASVDATCTSLSTNDNFSENSPKWGSLEAWGPTSFLPVFQLLGTNYKKIGFFSIHSDENPDIDGFTKIDFQFNDSVATVKVGTNIKSESDLIISGSSGYVYVPSPWWKTDYFEIRYENQADNKRCFYQVDGEGIRYELVHFVTAIREGKADFHIDNSVSAAIANVMNEYDLFKRGLEKK